MLASLLALAGLFVASYLALYKLGYIGTLACSVGSCETVQTSRWATFLGTPVAVWGVGYYVAVLAVSLAGLSGSLRDDQRVSWLLVAMTATGVLFSLWLTYLELFVIHAICTYCVISALIAIALSIVAMLDLRELRTLDDAAMAEAAAKLRVTGYGRVMRNTQEVTIRATKKDRET
jgi:uncharacterized membrane protein